MFQHIILTPFSYRRNNYNPIRHQDPLNRNTLRQRFRIFEMITLASIKSQEHKDFTWIIIIDPKLPDFYRQKFSEVISKIQDVYLIHFDIQIDQIGLDWLNPYIHKNSTHVITSLLGADDGLYKGFTKYVSEYYWQLFKYNKLQPLHFLSCKNVLQWDFFHSVNAPFGYLKPWTRKNTITVSTGISCCCKYPEMDFSMNGVGHRVIGFFFEKGEIKSTFIPGILSNIQAFAEQVRKKAIDSGLNWDGEMTRDKNYHEISTPGTQALVLNHFGNVRLQRIFEKSSLRRKFQVKEENFELELNYDIAEILIKKYQKKPGLLFSLIWRILFFDPEYDPGMSFKKKLLTKKKKIRGIIQGYRQLN